MNILAQQTPPASKQVKSISKYIYNRLDGAHNIRYKSNMCEIDVTVLYTILYLQITMDYMVEQYIILLHSTPYLQTTMLVMEEPSTDLI